MFSKTGGNWIIRLEHMLQVLDEIHEYTKDCDLFSFTEDTMRVRAVERAFEVIAEASKHIPSEIKAEYPYPWQDVIGMRNVISHEYQQINYRVLWDAARIEAPELKKLLLEIHGKYGEVKK